LEKVTGGIRSAETNDRKTDYGRKRDAGGNNSEIARKASDKQQYYVQ
jgi:hypothetical protein